MNGNLCDQYKARLVDYADGELPPEESAAVGEHLAACPHCRDLLAALRRSIQLAGAIWQAGEADLAGVSVPVRSRPLWPRLRRPLLAAACIFLLVGVSLIWRASQRASPAPGQNAPAIAEFERTVARAGAAMELLSAADYLAEQPGGQEIAQERFRYILTQYPETEAAAKCRSRIESIRERKT
jgi:anti-sigma factor RsiW